MKTILSYDEILLLGKLAHNQYSRWYPKDFPFNTPFDYVDSLSVDGDKCCVTAFLDPAGNVTYCGDTFEEALRWWIELSLSQPKTIRFPAYHVWYYAQQNELPKNPLDVWKLIAQEKQ